MRRESVPSQSQTAQNSLPSDIGNPERWDELFDFFASSQAYWARQPEEVRKLREIPDPWARRDYGIELAHRGFQIDPAIMIWGWDPLRTMLLRRYYGYSWVPAALQPPVLVAPGRQVPDGPSYDPLRPPPGAILVDISFAVVRSSPQIPASVSSTVGRRPQLLDRYL
ncbi:MAG: hypothetical protein RMK57_00955 [Bryobacterales bacterium]|nr:hypothetical protein [Bryobacteraceae bacterium]MDW8353073.1 hypothetical protein [Bryobacterales bacterium]